MSIATFLEANAGTGKTSRLTDTILNLVVNGTPLDRICAVTFTEKAANEMVERLRTKLAETIAAGILSPSAADQMNRCFIGTMHAFCTQLLKRHGDRLGMPPIFEVDDGSFFDSLFQARWDRLVSRVLKQKSHAASQLIALFGINAMQEMAEILASRRYEFRRPSEAHHDWLLEDLKDPQRWDFNPNYGWEATAYNALCSATDGDAAAQRSLLLLLCEGYKLPILWRDGIRDALNCRPTEMYDALSFLQKEFVHDLIREYRTLGWMRFDDLLIDTRDLLRNHRDIRRKLKLRYDRVLLDEMQDTDPVQYEILLYLCEKNDQEQDFRLQEITSGKKPLRLQEGKLFVVGDPKQSIYGFRSADVSAYERVRELLRQQGVEAQPLADNWRSCRNIVEFTNVLAERLFDPRKPSPSEPKQDLCRDKRMQDCVHIVRVVSEEADVQHLRVLTEANWLAEKIQALVGEGIVYEEIGILFRKLTNAHLYMDALCARNIPIVIEGEKFLYQTQEVIDVLNLLKWIVDELDSIALAGTLRSPLFGLNDLELGLFFQSYNGNHHVATALQAALEGDTSGRLEILTAFQEHIVAIRKDIRRLTPGMLMDAVLSRFPLLTVAGIAYGAHRAELAPLNILKIHKSALEADLDPSISTDRFVRMHEAYSKEGKETQQEMTADETVRAVRILSIHKAKGLDFPVVFVPLTDHGTGGFARRTAVLYDWQTGTTGIKVNGFTEDNYLHLRYKAAPPRIVGDALLTEIEDEERRVLYVAATRARKRMYFCYVENAAQRKDSTQGAVLFEFLKTLHPLVVERQENSSPWFPETPLQDALEQKQSFQETMVDWQRIQTARTVPHHPQLRPITAEAAELRLSWEPEVESSNDPLSLLTGLLCHGVLETIDYAAPENFKDQLDVEAGKLNEGYSLVDIERAKSEANQILESFLNTSTASWLASLEILGREVPATVFDRETNSVLSGKIDLIARENGACLLLDFKTNKSLSEEDRLVYKKQLALYARAVAPLLPAPPALKLCLLRSGEIIDLS